MNIRRDKLESLAPEVKITAKVNYIATESNPRSGFYLFSYRMKIQNLWHLSIRLMSRHWIIIDGLGNREDLREAGVEGAQPLLQPGQIFEYESAYPLGAPIGSMRGAYQMTLENGDFFDVEIPEFYLVAPCSLH